MDGGARRRGSCRARATSTCRRRGLFNFVFCAYPSPFIRDRPATVHEAGSAGASVAADEAPSMLKASSAAD